MVQPIRKKSGTFQKPRSKTVKKKVTPKAERDRRLPAKPKNNRKYVRHHQEFGTSKLEERFARYFLERLGVKYVYQFKAESIGRYYDFRILPNGPIIEIQGSYWHGDKRLYEESELNAIQKRNIKVDEKKRKWCSMNGIKLIYIWEQDINKNPDGVLNFLKEELKNYLP